MEKRMVGDGNAEKFGPESFGTYQIVMCPNCGEPVGEEKACDLCKTILEKVKSKPYESFTWEKTPSVDAAVELERLWRMVNATFFRIDLHRRLFAHSTKSGLVLETLDRYRNLCQGDSGTDSMKEVARYVSEWYVAAIMGASERTLHAGKAKSLSRLPMHVMTLFGVMGLSMAVMFLALRMAR